MQAELSERQRAVACVNDQLQQQQQRYITLQTKVEDEKSEAATAAVTQIEHYDRMKQQLQAQLNEAQTHGEGLQSECDTQGRKVEGLTAELSAAQTSVEQLQVSFASHLCKCCK